jgi:hypothetical protein
MKPVAPQFTVEQPAFKAHGLERIDFHGFVIRPKHRKKLHKLKPDKYGFLVGSSTDITPRDKRAAFQVPMAKPSKKQVPRPFH